MSVPDMYRVEIKPYDELTRDELHDIFHLRNVVFVCGQKITAEPDVDGRDPQCEHAMLWDVQGVKDGDRATLVGTARIFYRKNPQVVGRVAILTNQQRKGLGSILMHAVQAHFGDNNVRAELHAQAHLEGWYTRLGWKRVGDVFEEANIKHVMMEWEER